MRESNPGAWQIEWRCPQCGAPVVLDETDRIFSCAYCRVRLRISCRGPWRYCLPPEKGLTGDPIFVPYWRFRGLAFSCVNQEIQHRVVDSSRLALEIKGLPPSLGYRPQVLKLRPVSPSVGGAFLRPRNTVSPWPDVPGGLGEKATADEDKRPGTYEVFIGETISLLYSPVNVRGDRVFDGVLNRPLPSIPASELVSLPSEHFPNELVTFSPLLCLQCGWDLEGEKDSVVFLCRNCHSAWAASQEGLRQVDFSILAEPGKAPLHLPFWRIQAKFSGIPLESYADLLRLANLPKAVQRGWEDQKAGFWIPAFKLQPQLFLRLGRTLTLFQGKEGHECELPASVLHPVTLPIEEAVEGLVITVAAFSVPRKLILPRLHEIRAEVEGYRLCYVPFLLTSNECIQPNIGVSVNRNALGLGRSI
ncbi:MAG: hypothetical protein KBH99_10870 [Syntrophobacteraceae bacterium]|nr:hypothetical protein [Syntrophobacteraceae bacterium]